MKKFWRQVIVFTAMAGLLAALHILLHSYTFSFIILPAALAILLAYTLSTSAVALILLIGTAELFSAFPPGVMTAIVLIPYAIRKLFPAVEVGISGLFFILIAGTVALQLVSLTITNSALLASQMPLTWLDIWRTVPVQPLIISFGITTLTLFSLTIMWHELLLSTPTINPRLTRRI